MHHRFLDHVLRDTLNVHHMPPWISDLSASPMAAHLQVKPFTSLFLLDRGPFHTVAERLVAEIGWKKEGWLCIDNCPTHPKIPLRKIELIFLPAGTTCILQSLEQGVTKHWKAHYRSFLNQRIIAELVADTKLKASYLGRKLKF